MAEVILDGVNVDYTDGAALRDVSLTVADGSVMAVVGPSGSGKSTLLRVVAGLVQPTRGGVLFDGQPVTKQPVSQRNVGMVFQDNTLYPFMDARSNVAFPLELRRMSRSEVKDRVEAEARVLAIEGILDRMPAELSAGHQQLVQAARTLVRAPDVFLMDEPLARLDAKLRFLMRRELMLLQRGYGVTMLYATNDQNEALAVADTLAVIDGGQIRQVGSPMEVYNAPSDSFVAGFIGSPAMSFVPGSVVADGGGYAVRIGTVRSLFWTPALDAAVGRSVTIGVRPHEVRLGGDGPGAGTVIASEYTGDFTWLTIDIGSGFTVVARVPGPPPEIGSTVSVDVDAVHVFGADGNAIAHAALLGRTR